MPVTDRRKLLFYNACILHFTCRHSYLQFIGIGRNGATVAAGIGAVRIVAFIKIDRHPVVFDIAGAKVQVPAPAICRFIIGKICKGNEEIIFEIGLLHEVYALVHFQRLQRIMYTKTHDAITAVFFQFAAVGCHVEDRGVRCKTKRCRNAIGCVWRKEPQVTGVGSFERAMRIGKEILPVFFAVLRNTVGIGARIFLGRARKGNKTKQQQEKVLHTAKLQ